jgi:hypothetical protein
MLIEPTRRGKIASIGADGVARTRWARASRAWWYITDDDVWDLGCKCCPHPDGGVRAGDFFSGDAGRGYSIVLA